LVVIFFQVLKYIIPFPLSLRVFIEKSAVIFMGLLVLL
jgi:hypothetical protein